MKRNDIIQRLSSKLLEIMQNDDNQIKWAESIIIFLEKEKVLISWEQESSVTDQVSDYWRWG
jgi:hypothetical protein